ncbi:MAG: site-specific integrase [bacterium]|nr:site-specific integrase [bacterium]
MLDIQDFKLHLMQDRERRDSTVNYHLDNIKRLSSEIPEITATSVKDFLIRLKEEGKKGSYLNNFVNTLKIYADYAERPELGNIKYFKEIASEKAIMSDKEIEAFLNLPAPEATYYNNYAKKHIKYSTVGEHYYNWTMFFSIMAYTGMRPGEVAKMTINDVDFGRGVFNVRSRYSKTHQQRFVPIPPNIADKLQEYVDKLSTPQLFVQNKDGRSNGKLYDKQAWGYNFHQRINRLNIKRERLTPYSLRHSFITILLEQDVNLFKVQKIVGHRNIATTAIYTHMTTKDIQEAITKHPSIRKATIPDDIKRSVAQALQAYELNKDARFVFKLEETNDELNFSLKIVRTATA